MTCDKAWVMSDDIAITLFVVLGVFVTVILIGVFLLLILRELKKGNYDER